MGKGAGSVSIIGGADGPTSIFIAEKGGKVKLTIRIQNHFSDSFGYAMQHDIADRMEDYYAGKMNNAQMIKGNQTERNYCLSSSLVTYQCGEATWGKGLNFICVPYRFHIGFTLEGYDIIRIRR